MMAAPSTSYLLIAGGGNELETAFNRHFTTSIGDRATLWIVPSAPHTAAFGLYPDEYERRVIAFFDTTLLHHALKPPSTTAP